MNRQVLSGLALLLPLATLGRLAPSCCSGSGEYRQRRAEAIGRNLKSEAGPV